MLSFKEFLQEKLIVLGKQAYPKFGNVVIMAGGAGSGKGFVTSKLLGIEGQIFDVDALKKMALKSTIIKKKVHDELAIDLETFNQPGALKDPDLVSKLHDIMGKQLQIDKKVKASFYDSVLFGASDRKPNIIFDVTLQTMQKFDSLTRDVKELGYDPKNIHLVWVINDVEVAAQQNTKRERVVKYEILVNTHKGASQTMADIVNMGADLKKYLDGAIVFVFNQIKIDSKLEKSSIDFQGIPVLPSKEGSKGSYVKEANYFFIKKPGEPVNGIEQINKDIRDKIKAYVPKNIEW